MLPVARQGLDAIGIRSEESARYLGVIERRLKRRQTGAIWQQKRLARLKQTMPTDDALHQLLEVLIDHSVANLPVADWQP
jgi:CBS-domain-containing membrane protein